VAEDHIGLDGVRSVDEMAVVKRQVVENTTGTAVLNADDPRCLAMIGHSPAERVFLFSGDPHSAPARRHVEAGGCAVLVEQHGPVQSIAIFLGQERQHVATVDEIPLTDGGRARYNVENAVAAAAAAYAAGVPVDAIRKGLRSFRSDLEHNPGRFNEFTGLPFRVIIDSPHNAAGVEALVRRLDSEPCAGQRIAVFSVATSMTDDGRRDMTRAAADAFDRFICTIRIQPADPALESAVELVRSTLIERGVPDSRITSIPDRTEAIDAALAMATAGDEVVIFLSPIDGTVQEIADKLRHLAAA